MKKPRKVIKSTAPAPSGDAVFQIKKAILQVAGNSSFNPNQLGNGFKMEDFALNDMQLVDLAQRLTAIRRNIKPDSAPVSFSDVSGCDTVGDCVSLVTA